MNFGAAGRQVVRGGIHGGGDAVDAADALALLGASPAGNVPFTGVRRLMLAVLEDGIRCYFSRVPRIRAEAEMWVHSGRRAAFSFDAICDLFGVEPDAARASLRRLRRHEERPAMLRVRHRGTVRRAALSARG